MSPSVTPAGILDLPASASVPTVTHGQVLGFIRYPSEGGPAYVYSIHLPQPAPPGLRLSLELGREEAGVWIAVPELDVSAEGEDINAAFRNLLGAVRDWLSYLRDENPPLADELASQARYVPLLDAPVFSWFKSVGFAG